jgi:hypothetical protein
MGILLLLVCFFGSGYLIVYIIDTLKGETKLIKKCKREKLTESISKKIESGEEFSDEELALIEDANKMHNLQYDLLRHDIMSRVNKEKK